MLNNEFLTVIICEWLGGREYVELAATSREGRNILSGWNVLTSHLHSSQTVHLKKVRRMWEQAKETAPVKIYSSCLRKITQLKRALPLPMTVMHAHCDLLEEIDFYNDTFVVASLALPSPERYFKVLYRVRDPLTLFLSRCRVTMSALAKTTDGVLSSKHVVNNPLPNCHRTCISRERCRLNTLFEAVTNKTYDHLFRVYGTMVFNRRPVDDEYLWSLSSLSSVAITHSWAATLSELFDLNFEMDLGSKVAQQLWRYREDDGWSRCTSILWYAAGDMKKSFPCTDIRATSDRSLFSLVPSMMSPLLPFRDSDGFLNIPFNIDHDPPTV